MKKKTLVPAMVLAMVISAGSAFADEVVVPISDMPLDTGIVIDVSDMEGVPQDVTGIDNIPGFENQVGTTPIPQDVPTDGAQANDGTELPLDQGEVEIDTGSDQGVVEVATTEPVPEKDTVVLTDKPVVEPLAQTGIADNKGIAVGALGLLGLVGMVLVRKRKEQTS